jgi:DNA-binding response OmpR family regulator
MSPQRILLVADHDPVVRQAMVDGLADAHGFIVIPVGTLSEVDAAIKAKGSRFDAVILDVAMPDRDGSDYCAKLRCQGHSTTVVLLTGHDSEAEVVRGLDAGPNDYIAKPLRMNELRARLRTQWRMSEDRPEAVFAIGPYTFRPAAKLLHDPIRNCRIPLTAKEAAILKFLVLSDGRPMGRQILLRDVWGYHSGATTHTVETHIHRLRRKMELHPKRPALLLSEHGGYRLNMTAGAADETRGRPGVSPG